MALLRHLEGESVKGRGGRRTTTEALRSGGEVAKWFPAALEGVEKCGYAASDWTLQQCVPVVDVHGRHSNWLKYGRMVHTKHPDNIDRIIQP